GVAGMGLGLGDPPADYGSISAVGLFVALMCVCIIVGHLLEENRWMNESITALFIVSRTPPVLLLFVSLKFVSVVGETLNLGILVAGAGDRRGDTDGVEREALARAGVQRGPLLHLPAAAH